MLNMMTDEYLCLYYNVAMCRYTYTALYLAYCVVTKITIGQETQTWQQKQEVFVGILQ